MSGKPFLNFNVKDWLTAPELRRCSAEARALWMDLLCLSVLDNPIGVLSDKKGSPLTAGDVVSLIPGWSLEVVTASLLELSENGVFSVDRKGRIYSRRIVRDEKFRKNGRLGGNPNLMKNKENPERVNTIPTRTRSRARVSPPIPLSPDKESFPHTPFKEINPIPPSPPSLASLARHGEEGQNGKNGKNGKTENGATPHPKPGSSFDRFWRAYPHKVGKRAAEQAFGRAIQRAGLDEILAGLERYKRDKPPQRDWCNPQTFLNQDRWSDQPAPPPLLVTMATGPPAGVDEWEELRQKIQREENAENVRRAGGT